MLLLGCNCLHLILAELFIRPVWLWLVLVAFLRLLSYLHMLTRYVNLLKWQQLNAHYLRLATGVL
jgi:hypothetical protein